MRAEIIKELDGSERIYFECPACGSAHGVPVNRGPQTPGKWGWNGKLDAPTLVPSLAVNPGRACPSSPECHHFIRDGYIIYLNDCSHAMKGKTVPLPELTR